MKIGDLWVKLGLKKEEFSRGMKEAGEEVSGAGGLLGKIKAFKGGTLAVWAAVAAGAVAMADKFAHTSQRLGDQWDQVTAGLRASWGTFIAAVNSTDFSNLGKRMADSFRAARNVAASADAEFEVMNSIELRKSAMREELALLQVQMRNQRLSQQERIDAAKEYLAKIKPLYDEEAEYRKKHAIAVQNAWLTGAELREDKGGRAALRTFLTGVANDPQLLAALDEYKKAGYRTSSASQKAIIDAFKENNQGTSLRALANLATYYQRKADKDVKPVVDAILAADKAAAAFNEETRRVQQVQNQAVTVGGGGSSQQDKFEQIQREALARIERETERQLEAIDKEIDKLEPEKFEPLEIVPPDLTEWDAFYEKFKADQERMQELLKGFRDAVTEGFSAGVQEFTDQLFGLEDINPGKVVQALLSPLADMAIKEGEILIAQGIGVEACKKALESLNGIPAIAAGATLVAIGAAAKSGLSALAASKGGTSASSTYQGSGTTASQTQLIESELTVHVEGRISGSDILLSGTRTASSYNR